MNKKQKKMLLRILLSAALLGVLLLLPLEGWLRFALFLIPYLIVGYDILIEAFEGIRNGQPFDENFLMAVATVGALALGEYTEGVAVMLLYQTGELFQSYAVGKSRRSIGALMDIRPDSANLLGEDGEIRTVDPDEVEIGSVIVVRPGEKIPIDGVIAKGKSSLDTAALTGESIPREVKEGSEVISGCINLSGLIEIRTTKDFGESTVSKILDLVENATSRKSKSENFISKFARIYTPAVCFGALALFLLPPLAGLLLDREAQWSVWLYRALTFLVISCPCALVISIPLSFFAGIGGASANGILIKGSNFMETLSEVRTVVLDKTGTLTEGNFEVSGVHHSTIEDEKLIEYAAHAEVYSSHPISRSLIRAYGREPEASRVSDVREESGRGVIAKVDGREVAVGSAKLMRALGCEPIDCSHVGTIVHVAIDGSYAGHILIEDLVKDGAQEAIESLRRSGVKKIVMLTGDVRAVAEDVAKRLKLDVRFNYSLGNDVYNYMRSQLEGGSRFMNQTTALKHRWQAEGQETDIPKITFQDPMGNSRFSDRWIEDGSYLRLKTATLSYELPVNSEYIQGFQFWIQGNNLLTFTKYLGSDPEFTMTSNVIGQGIDLGSLGQCRSIVAGVKINL